MQVRSTVVTLRHLDRPASGDPVGALVFLHGYAGNPMVFVAFLNEIDPERRFHGYVPQAPHPAEGERTSWFDRGSREPAEEQLAPVAEWLDTLPYPRERTILGGWSQGANVAYALALGPNHARPAGVIALGGGFRDELPPDLDRRLPPIAIAHGSADDSVSISVARQARDILERAGATVLYLETEVGHEIDEVVIPDLRAFLARLP
ncbi:MAG: alpha/beta fold hydrolase [Actinomycetota bacterium]|nr:alpha/beta fold hydrolase [Actinomycetota bacterium]